MADQRRRPDKTVYGNLAYDLDNLVLQRQLEEAGKDREQERQTYTRPEPRRQAEPQPRAKPSLLLIGSIAALAVMVMLLIMGYVQLTTISGNVTELKSQLSALDDQHVSLLTKYEQTFDLATVKEAAEAAGMSKPTGAQIEYVDLSGSDTAVVYRAGAGGVLSELAQRVENGFAALVEYFR